MIDVINRCETNMNDDELNNNLNSSRLTDLDLSRLTDLNMSRLTDALMQSDNEIARCDNLDTSGFEDVELTD